MNSLDTDIVIAGGGPVGLYLAGRLLQKGISCRVLEKRTSIDRHSKSLGIHPVSLELFDEAGIINPFLEKGLKIKKGIAYWDTDKIGEITFETCPPPFRFILALPQWQTESILEEWVQSLDSSVLIRGAEVSGILQNDHSVGVTYKLNSRNSSIKSRFLVGCDGKNSIVRQLAGIPFQGEAYPDSYIMGDFEDNTQFSADAVVFLHPEGLIESFPLPNGQRRWVVKTDKYIKDPTSDLLASMIQVRIQHTLIGVEHFMMSSFGVQQYIAESFFDRNILLAGDAAHVVSPIGGQGMNLGLLDAKECVSILGRVLENPSSRNSLFSEYQKKQKKIARQVARRAEMNMHLGRKETSTLFYKLLLSLFLKTPLNSFLAKLFTMRGLGKWWM